MWELFVLKVWKFLKHSQKDKKTLRELNPGLLGESLLPYPLDHEDFLGEGSRIYDLFNKWQRKGLPILS